MSEAAAHNPSAIEPAGAVNPEPAKPARQRIDSVDLLRGIVMVIMMLDHTRDFVHQSGFLFDPTDLTRTNVALFLTRWITHFCAPVFVFLAGTGAYLQWTRGKSKGELSRFLVTRGLWLIVLECTLVKFGMWFTPDLRLLGFFQVIWVIGVSMIVLAGLIHLPVKIIAAFGLLMIALHNLLDRFQVQGWRPPNGPIPGLGAKLWILLHEPFQAFPVLWFQSPVVIVVYPLIPWIGVMAVGYAFGALYQKPQERRRKMFLAVGGIATALFILIRATNLYGDPSRWVQQKNLVFTILSFINTTKYPPSLLFLLMTLGPSIAVLAWFERAGRGVISNIFVTYGRVPLFFYLLQWPTAHLISVLLHWATGKPVRWLFLSPLDLFANPPPPSIGFNLWIVYGAWLAGVILLYPLCKWFAGVKARRRDWWLSYL